jgi:imidazoleglycerol-phosphate dehydratase
MENTSERRAQIKRKTNETDIDIEIGLDGTGVYDISTGIGFLDHMLRLFARHGLFDLRVKVIGDLEIDAHHTVEDTGIVLGQAIDKALGSKEGIRRYGTAFIPMDEALSTATVDVGGRVFLVYDVTTPDEKVGDMETQLFLEFFRAFSVSAKSNIHLRTLYGGNSHHIIESVFKAFARAMAEAVSIDPRVSGVMSTKGLL